MALAAALAAASVSGAVQKDIAHGHESSAPARALAGLPYGHESPPPGASLEELAAFEEYSGGGATDGISVDVTLPPEHELTCDARTSSLVSANREGVLQACAP